MKNKKKIWYSFYGGHSEDDAISYYDSNQFNWTSEIEKNWEEIAKEIAIYLNDNEEKIKPYFNTDLVTKSNSWKTSAFFFWKWTVKKNMKQCPFTMSTLQKVPGILSASISILESDITIKPHRGDTNAIIRAHLPLKVPHQLPDCGFQVNEEQKSWEEGKLILFNDAAKHTAWNNTSDRRYVLLFDVIRPEFQHKKYTVSSRVLAGLVMQAVAQKMPFIKRFPKFILAAKLFSIAFFINLILRFRSFFKL